MKKKKIEYTYQLPGYEEAFNLILPFFNERIIAEAWMHARNPLLGNVTPVDMLLLGRKEKLLKFIRNQLKENKR